MFTIKFYGDRGSRQRIMSAESFTVLRGDEGAEITLHQSNAHNDCRIDIMPGNTKRTNCSPPVYDKAIIENSTGKTTEIIVASPGKPA